uniref:Small ribosomal subunit protein uS17c n=1 Tax=Gronococcus sybilensis TaxID=3028029 RepID=A0A9Y1I2Q7_9RHOD|nr:ribosomal protein S17 [Gronococcus sybilensis]
MALKEKTGIVVSVKMQKTIVVNIENRTSHSKYAKVIGKTKRYKVHDESSSAQMGDRVLIQESRPLSKTKRWTLKEILLKASKLDLKE